MKCALAVKAATDQRAKINIHMYAFFSPQYIRLSYDTSPELLVELLTKEWRIPKPNLIFSVKGGSSDFIFEQKEKFAKKLMKVARTTGTWVITGKLLQ